MKKIILLCILFGGIKANSQQVTDFTLNDLTNAAYSFSELKGEKLTLIDFWTTWCRPCMRAIPELNKFHETYQHRGVNVIGINCDGPRSVSKVLPLSRSLKIKYTVLLDINAEVMKSLHLSAFPTLVFVNPEGKIIWIHEGFISGDEELIKRQIEKHLSGPS